jgi:K+-transporting ATPase ATPase B chain
VSGRAEAAGDCHPALDKIGTITFGNRQADVRPRQRGHEEELPTSPSSSLADETPEGRSIVVLAKERYGIRKASWSVPRWSCSSSRRARGPSGPQGRAEAVRRWPRNRRRVPDQSATPSTRSAQGDSSSCRGGRRGSSPLPPARVIYLKDIVKPGIAERFADLRGWASAR